MIYKEYNEKDLQSFEYETTIQSDGKIIGVCELGKATIQMINDSNNYSSYKGSWIKTVHGSFYVYDVEPVQEKVNIKLECYDIKYKLDTLYDKTKYTFPLTLKEWRNSIFENCGVEYDNSDFPNSDLLLTEQPYVEENSSNRDVIKAIGEAGCSFIITDSNDKFYFSWFDNATQPHVAKDWLELTTEKEESEKINLVILGRGNTEDNVYYPEEKPTNPVEFRIDNNYILDPQENEDKRYDVIQPIYNRVNNFSYLVFNMRSQSIDNKLSIKLGQKIKYKDIWNNELTAYIMTKKINWLGGKLEDDNNYEITLSADEIKETSTDVSYAASVKNDLLKVERKADKNSGEISDLVEKNSEFSTKLTEITQKTEEISQTVSDIENLEREITNNNYIYIEKATKGQLLNLTINGPVSLIFPSSNTYPSNNLFLLNSYLIVDKTRILSENAKKIFLPFNKLDVGDKFIIENGKTRIEKSTGEVKKLDDINIELFDGENYIYLESFQNNNVVLYAKYIIKNQYTDNLVGKVEMENKIEQTAEQTNIELSKKVDNDKIIARINMSTEKDKDGSYIGIEADKLNFKGKVINLTGDDVIIKSTNFNVDKDGRITATAGDIGGFSLNDTSFYTHIQDNYTYATNDLERLKEILQGSEPTTDELLKYDVNDDGKIDSSDVLIIQRKIFGYESTEGDFYLYSNNPRYFMQAIGNGTKTKDTKIGLSMFQTTEIYACRATFKDLDNSDSETYINGGNINCVSLTQTSQEKNKKNFEKYSNALEELEKIDIYKYNLKNEPDGSKKHLGFVIGNDFNYSELITSSSNEGVDNYSFTSLCFQMIKEQQEIIKKLEKRVQALEKGEEKYGI